MTREAMPDPNGRMPNTQAIDQPWTAVRSPGAPASGELATTSASRPVIDGICRTQFLTPTQ
jgi:hypothetical protein